MKLFKKFAIVTLASFSLGNAAYSAEEGGLFVEPMITYEAGKTETNFPSPFSNSSGNIDGLGIGARLGFHLSEAFFLGLDARYAMPQFKDSSVNYDAKAVSTNYGPVVGFQMPDVGVRLMASYIMGGELDPEGSGSLDVKFADYKGYRVGAGFRVAMVSVNVEYQDAKYENVTLQSIGSFSPGTNFSSVDTTNKGWIGSVSFPLEL